MKSFLQELAEKIHATHPTRSFFQIEERPYTSENILAIFFTNRRLLPHN